MFSEVALTLCEMNIHLFGKCFIFSVKTFSLNTIVLM